MESAIENGASIYSIPCKPVKIAPNKIVKNNPKIASSRLPAINPWCDHVTVAQLVNKIAVFNNGTWYGFNTSIPTGGQTAPNSTDGDKLLWKYAQKKEKNNNASETMNKITPCFNPDCTSSV